MRILVAHTKGGVGKTTTAVHLAAALHEQTQTAVLIDMDTNPAALDWSIHGNLPMPVRGMREGRALIDANEGFVVIDAPARPGADNLVALADDADLVVIPTPPADLALRALRRVVTILKASTTPYRVLLTLVPPHPSDLGAWARGILTNANIPIYPESIPRTLAFEHAANTGVLVKDIRRGKAAWLEYQRVAGRIVQHAK